MTTTYSIYADGGRDYSTGSATKAASVACAWKRQGHAPVAWAVYGPDDGPVATTEVAVSTVRETSRALVAAGR